MRNLLLLSFILLILTGCHKDPSVSESRNVINNIAASTGDTIHYYDGIKTTIVDNSPSSYTTSDTFYQGKLVFKNNGNLVLFNCYVTSHDGIAMDTAVFRRDTIANYYLAINGYSSPWSLSLHISGDSIFYSSTGVRGCPGEDVVTTVSFAGKIER